MVWPTSLTCATHAVLGLGGGLDGRVAVLAQVGEAVGDPVHVLLDGHDHVAEHRRAARAGDGEEVREAGDGEAEVACAGLRPTSAAASGPARPRMSMLSSAPVMASNPVAKTMLSSAYVRVPRPQAARRDGLDRAPSRTSTRVTLSRL